MSTQANQTEVRFVNCQEAFDACQVGKGVLIDVRTPVEYQSAHAGIASNAPLESLDIDMIKEKYVDSGKEMYLICASGNRSQKAAEALVKAGMENVHSVEGGTREWESLNLPVLRGKKSISLERQVRITAGLLALTGALLAWFVDPKWVILPGFIGAGLTFAGVTDTCGMAMMLARMPWNQVRAKEGCQVKLDS